MSTKKESTTTNQYDSQSMTRYQSAQNSLYKQANSLWSNPFGNSQYTMGLQMQTNAANQLGANSVSNAMRSANMAGTGDLTGGARASLLSGLSRQTSGMRQQGFLANFQNAQSNMWNAGSLLSSMQPLQTGQNNVQKTSGLGTWLPQVASAAGGIAMGLATGGASAAGGRGGQLTGTAGAMSSMFSGSGMNQPYTPFGNQMSQPFQMPGQSLMNGPGSSSAYMKF